MALPRFMVLLRTSNVYVRLVKEDNESHGFFEFAGRTVMDPCVKLEVERARSGNGLVNIRSCYNNKYLVRESSSSRWIKAAADEPDEDQSSWSCTLFRPAQEGTSIFRFRIQHVKLGRNLSAVISPGVPSFNSVLCLSVSRSGNGAIFQALNWDDFCVLPKHVAFKGDNGRYISARTINGQPHLQFAGNDIADPTVWNKVSYSNDGITMIKSNHFNSFWRGRLSPSDTWISTGGLDSELRRRNSPSSDIWIYAGGLDAEFQWFLGFSPILVGREGNIIALGNDLRTQFAERHSASGLADCLALSSRTVSPTARLEVEEIVLSRRIENVNFRLSDSRIYGQRPVMKTSVDSDNRTSNPSEQTLEFEYRETETRTWNASVSLRYGTRATFRAGIPIFASGRIEVGVEARAEYEWGNTTVEEKVLRASKRVTVPPMKRVTVSLLVSEASYDVPFSYTQYDLLPNGREVSSEMDDGLFTGMNSYNLRFEAVEEDLPTADNFIEEVDEP